MDIHTGVAGMFWRQRGVPAAGTPLATAMGSPALAVAVAFTAFSLVVDHAGVPSSRSAPHGK